MGRGRAKAKQTKVARELKYHTPSTDFAALERELTSKDEPDDKYRGDDPADDYDDSSYRRR